MVYIFWEEIIQHSRAQKPLRRRYFICEVGLSLPRSRQKEDVLDLMVFGAAFHTGDTVLVFLFLNIYFFSFVKLFSSGLIGL